MKIAVLCVQANSVYKGIPDADCYDMARDARTFPGGMAVIAHPPCRSWSAFCSHQAKPLPGEKDLGPWCAEQVKQWGGILEHPAHSRLFAAAGLPMPAEVNAHGWTIEVWQSCWGYPMHKKTWLFFSKIKPQDVHFPLQLRSEKSGDKRTWQLMGKAERSRTTVAFAQWLIHTAQKTKTPLIACPPQILIPMSQSNACGLPSVA
jgi:hypothetical protein